ARPPSSPAPVKTTAAEQEQQDKDHKQEIHVCSRPGCVTRQRRPAEIDPPRLPNASDSPCFALPRGLHCRGRAADGRQRDDHLVFLPETVRRRRQQPLWPENLRLPEIL